MYIHHYITAIEFEYVNILIDSFNNDFFFHVKMFNSEMNNQHNMLS